MTVAPPPKIRRLLFLSCTRSKRREPELLPAIERYDGPVFRVVRRFRNTTAEPPETYILSAQFGLIPSDQLIPYYDERMTPRRAQELRPQVGKAFRRIISAGSAGRWVEMQLFFCMGKVYFEAIMPCVPTNLTVERAGGPIGRMSSELHLWLYGPNADAGSATQANSPLGAARLRGIEVVMTPAEVFEEARRALPRLNGVAAGCHTWYVTVDQARVSPKWLVSLITGLPVRDFHSSEARRVLRRLGVEVRRAGF
jgi:hypothetical protein